MASTALQGSTPWMRFTPSACAARETPGRHLHCCADLMHDAGALKWPVHSGAPAPLLQRERSTPAKDYDPSKPLEGLGLETQGLKTS